jgi:hypothetical protein
MTKPLIFYNSRTSNDRGKYSKGKVAQPPIVLNIDRLKLSLASQSHEIPHGLSIDEIISFIEGKGKA